MHVSRPVLLAGVGFAVIAMLLPFASFPIVGSVDGISADAWPALIPLVPMAVIAMSGDWSHGLDSGPGITTVVLGGTSLVFALVKVADAVVAARDTQGATLGPGSLVLAAAASVAVAAAGFGALSKT